MPKVPATVFYLLAVASLATASTTCPVDVDEAAGGDMLLQQSSQFKADAKKIHLKEVIGEEGKEPQTHNKDGQTGEAQDASPSDDKSVRDTSMMGVVSNGTQSAESKCNSKRGSSTCCCKTKQDDSCGVQFDCCWMGQCIDGKCTWKWTFGEHKGEWKNQGGLSSRRGPWQDDFTEYVEGILAGCSYERRRSPTRRRRWWGR